MTEIQLSQAEFVEAITDAAVAAGKDRDLPVLCAVHMAGKEGESEVTFTATDRFILVRRTVRTAAPLAEDISAMIPTEQVKVLASVLKLTAAERRSGQPAPLAVTVDESKLRAGNVTVPLDDSEPLKVEHLFDKGLQADAEITVLGVDLALLLRVSKLSAHRRGSYTHLHFTKGYDGNPGMLFVRTGDAELDAATQVVVMPARVLR